MKHFEKLLQVFLFGVDWGVVYNYSGVSCCMVYGVWFMVYGVWCMLLTTCCIVAIPMAEVVAGGLVEQVKRG